MDHRRLELDDVGMAQSGYCVTAPMVTPDPKPMTAARGLWSALGCAACQKTKGMRPTMICVDMSSPFEASTLPLFLSATVCDHFSTLTVVAMPSW